MYVIPTLHPAHIVRGAPMSDVIAADLRKAVRLAEYGPTQIENIVVAHPSSPVGEERATALALSWLQRWIDLKVPVAVDVETSSVDFQDCKLYSVALSGDDGHNTAVAFTLCDVNTLSWQYEAALVRKLREVLYDPDVPTIYHNAPFDYAVLTRKGYNIGGPILDTQAYAHIIQPDIPKDLGWIGHQWLDVEPWKLDHEGRKMAQTSDVIELLVYNAKDALNTMKLRSPLHNEVLERGMSTSVIQYQMAYSRLAARMELYGVPLDYDLWRKRCAELYQDSEKHLYEMRQYLNWADFNPKSRNHAMEALFEQPRNGHNNLSLTPTEFTPSTQEPSVSYKAIIDHIEHPFVRSFISYVEKRDAWATRYRTAEEGKPGGFARMLYDDGRFHPKWNPTGQRGTRFSSSANVQNVPPKERDIFAAPYGRAIVYSDKSQLELRIIACNAGVRELVEEMAKPDADPHRMAAMNIYGEAFHQRNPAEQTALRNMVKNVVYASLYNAGPQTVWRTLRVKKELDPAMRAAMTLAVVSHIHKSYFGRYVEIPALHERNYQMAMSVGYNECAPLGRRRYYPSLPPPFTEVGNWQTQSSGAEYVGIEMIHIQEDMDRETGGDSAVILHGHDAVYIECKESYAERAAQLVKHHFGCTPIEGPAGRVNLTADVKIGRTMLEKTMKKVA
jgi:DNA polymerase I-like protein with 3'-5' exonuclease and polymerase domains